MTINRVATCQAVLAEALGLDELSFDENSHAVVAMDGGFLHLQMIDEEEAQVLVLVADLGAIGTDPEIQQTLLIGNLSWRDVAGGALALDPEGRNALLVVRLDLAALNEAALAQRLYATIDAAERWTAELAAMVDSVRQERASAARSAYPSEMGWTLPTTVIASSDLV